VQTLQPNTRLALAGGLTLPQVQIRSQLVRQWRQQAVPTDNRTPVVFAFGR
jgi:16S rRNA (cytidine1402-2'-O)-methyltransferase